MLHLEDAECRIISTVEYLYSYLIEILIIHCTYCLWPSYILGTKHEAEGIASCTTAPQLALLGLACDVSINAIDRYLMALLVPYGTLVPALTLVRCSPLRAVADRPTGTYAGTPSRWGAEEA